MRRYTCFLIAVAVLAAVPIAAGHAARAGCTPKHTTIGGKPATIECGPATATVHYAGKTITYSGGTCKKQAGFYSLYIGTKITGGTSKHLFFAFGSVTKDGTYTPAKFVDGFQLADGAYSLHTGTTTLSGNLHKGTFSGGTIVVSGTKSRPGGKLSGSFDCSGSVGG
jgi:hypothetical protein